MNFLQKTLGKWLSKAGFIYLGADAGALFRSAPSISGQTVSVDRSLQLSTAWACIRLLTETISTLPISVYGVDADGKKTVARDHPLYALLHDQPNADMTAVDFYGVIVTSLCTWGNAFVRKLRLGGAVVALEPLRPERITVKRENDGSITYKYRAQNGDQVLPEDEVMHVRGFGMDGLLGLSPVSYARQSLGAAMAIEEASAGFFKNGLSASGFLKVPGFLKQEQRALLNEAIDKYRGTQGQGKVMILEGGMDFGALSLTPEDAQMLASRQFHVEEICRWFGVPPFMVGHTEKSTSWGTGLEQQMIGFLTFALRPYLTRIEQAIRRCLLAPEERGAVSVEFNLEGLLRADSAARAAFYSQVSQNGIYTRNEIRAKENLPPVPGGDVLTVQSNLLPIDQLGRQPVPPVGKAIGENHAA